MKVNGLAIGLLKVALSMASRGMAIVGLYVKCKVVRVE
jgi:hypothetical protein